jgi:rod shape-determining protein MreD
MSYIGLIFCAYFATVLEGRLANVWEVAGVAPDLCALLAFGWLTVPNRKAGLPAVAIIGLISDLSQTTPLGVTVGAFGVVGFALIELQRRFRLDALPLRICAIGFATAAIASVQCVAARYTGQTLQPFGTLIGRSLLTGAYTAAIALPLLMVLSWRAAPNSEAAILRG